MSGAFDFTAGDTSYELSVTLTSSKFIGRFANDVQWQQMRGHCSVVSFVRHKRVYQNYHFKVAVEGVSKCDFAMSRDVACRVSMFATTYKTFNINSLSNQIVETQNFASLLPH